MTIDWEAILTKHSSGIFTLAGVIIGAGSTFISGLILKRQEFNYGMTAKLFKRRIAAHERVIALAMDLRLMLSPGGTNEYGETPRYPQIMQSKEVFQEWFLHFSEFSRDSTTWLSTGTKRELNFCQDYLATLHTNLANIPSDTYKSIGTILRQDFIDLSSSLEKSSFSFFQHGIRRLKLDSLDDWHKYPKHVTISRMNSMLFVKEWPNIKNIIGPPGPESSQPPSESSQSSIPV